jgi:GNAT superfamily N-acetyltransferase
MATTFRLLHRDDRPAILEILRATRAFSPPDVQVAVELVDCYLKDGRDSGYHFHIAIEDDCLAGYICYGPTPLTKGTWDVYWIVTTPHLKGHGIGSQLLRLAEENVKAEGGRMLLIETSSSPLYLEARRFYLNRGYVIVSSIPDFYAPGDNKITFRKVL